MARRREFGHPLSYAGDRWVCPATGLVVPKDPVENGLLRQRLWHYGEQSPEWAFDILRDCHASFLYWLNMFGWTYRLITHKAEGSVESSSRFDVPFITWPCQDAAIAAIQAARAAGEPVAVEKSRDMGASWLCIAYIVWDCLFPRMGRPANWLLVSKKEEDVYTPGNQKALFTKIEYLLNRVPPWMRQPYRRVERLITMPERNGSVIAGESTNSFAGVGDRVTGLFIDEASAIETLARIEMETSDTGPFRIFNSTNRAGTYFTSHLLPSGRVRIVNLAWWDHPEKGKDRRLVEDKKTKSLRYTSPWYETQKKRRSARDVAQNLDMDRMGAGTGVFDGAVIARQKHLYGGVVVMRGTVGLAGGVRIDRDAKPATWPKDRIEWSDVAEGPWRWFGELVPDTNRMRPDQRHGFVMGVDVSMGTGASPSVISVMDVDSGWKVARYLDTRTSPETLGDIIYAVGHWIGGRTGTPLVVVESNGPGRATLLRLRELSYPRIYQRENIKGLNDTTMPELGWHSGRPEKEALLSKYADALATDKYRNPDEEALDEHVTYLYYENGGIGPSAIAELKAEDRARHGDMTIADALAFFGSERVPKASIDDHVPSFGSAGDRRKRMSERQALIRKALGVRR